MDNLSINIYAIIILIPFSLLLIPFLVWMLNIFDNAKLLRINTFDELFKNIESVLLIKKLAKTGDVITSEIIKEALMKREEKLLKVRRLFAVLLSIIT